MISRRQGTAAVALAAAVLAASPARADRLEAAEHALGQVEGRLAAVEKVVSSPDEDASARSLRHAAQGRERHAAGDWLFAAILLTEAVDSPDFKQAPEYPETLFLLADALRRQGDCGSARPRYQAYLYLQDSRRRGEALSGALECALKEKRLEEVDRLAPEAERAFRGELPPETAYAVAKAVWFRKDLRPKERRDRSLEAFEAVNPPYDLAARYFQGAILVEDGQLDAAVAMFRACSSAKPADARARQVREQCLLALARVLGEQGQYDAALEAYRGVPRESPLFDETLFEMAWVQVKAKRYDLALHTASAIADLVPDSPLAPEAIILQGHLLLKLGKYAAATEAYNRVINTYAPVRDEIDAILAMQDDPVRYFNDLLGRRGKASDNAAALPPAAVKWAALQPGVSEALRLIAALEASRREVREADALAERLDAAVSRSGGIDAFVELSEAYAAAEAALNGAARMEGEIADRAFEICARSLAKEGRSALEKLRASRRALQKRLDALPQTLKEVRERAERMREKLLPAEQGARQLALAVEGADLAIAETEVWLESHRAEINADAAGRREFIEELRNHRLIIEQYREGARALQLQIAQARDAASGIAALKEEARVRDEYRALAAKERQMLQGARYALDARAEAELQRGEALVARAAGSRERAARVEMAVATSAARRARLLKERVAVERASLEEASKGLDRVLADSRELVGKVAYRSYGAVREQFYKLVLKADIGIVDIAWTRKRERLDKIQQLSMQKSTELQQIELDYKGLLREVD